MARITLVVMAAGVGTRYGGMKQIDPIGPNGETALSYCVYDALRAGFDRVVFVIRERMKRVFRESIGQVIERQVDTAYVFQELDRLPPGAALPRSREKPWGTGHAVLCCRDEVATPFAVINADDLYGPTAYRLMAEHLARVAHPPSGEGTKTPPPGASLPHYCMVGFILKNTTSPHGTVARGICDVSPDGYLRNVTERTRIREVGGAIHYADGDRWVELSPDSIASMNIWGLTPDFFEELEARFVRFLRANSDNPKAEYYLPEVVGALARGRKARIAVLKTNDRWYGITYQEDKPGVQQAIRDMIRAGVYPEKLWA